MSGIGVQVCGSLGNSLPLMGRSSPPPPKKEQTRQTLGPRFDLKLMALLCQFYSLQRVLWRLPKRYSRKSIRRTRSLFMPRTALPRRSILAEQRIRPVVLLQRPPERESLKVAAGVSLSERGAEAPRGRREGARVPYALADLV